jgi:predicted MFS family arabinose efflux permease
MESNGLASTLMYLGIMICTILSGFVMEELPIVVAFLIAGLAFLVCTFILYKSSRKGLFKDI